MQRIGTALGVCVCALALAAGVQSQKRYKDQGEYEIYSSVAKDLAAHDAAKALTGLDAWKQKYPATDFESDRQLLYVQSYSAARQPAKAVDAAVALLKRNPDETLGNPGSVVKLLFTTAVAIQQVPDATAEQLSAGGQAAKLLLEYGKKPEGLTGEAWTQARVQLQAAARGALLFVALAPGVQAMQKKDCAAAETAFTRAVTEYPQSAQAAYSLGTAQYCLYRTQPDKAPAALYAFARAAAVDPAKGMVDPKWQRETVEPYLARFYAQYHGPDPAGLEELKRTATMTPLPPAGFTVKSLARIAEEKQAEFEKSNPQLALWMKVKGALAGTGGEQYFASTLKDAAVPQLRGVLVEAKPACRPKELLVAVPLPGAPRPLQPEIALKLEKPLAGKPQPDAEFLFEGVPQSYAPSPFLLTMDADPSKFDGLRTTPCGVTPVRKKK